MYTSVVREMTRIAILKRLGNINVERHRFKVEPSKVRSSIG
jgi:hypothetical protein